MKQQLLVIVIALLSTQLAFAFSEANSFTSSISTHYDSSSYAIFDYNNDGRQDFIYCTYATSSGNSNNITRVFKNTGLVLSEDTSQILNQTKECTISYLDFDNDGYFDLFLTGYESQPIAVLYENQGGNFSQSNQSFNGVYDGGIVVFDYDNDGDIDIFYTGCEETPYNVLSCGSHSAYFYENQEGSFSLNNSKISEFSSNIKSGISVGDYNNDGIIDLVIIGSTDGSGFTYQSALLQLLNGSGFNFNLSNHSSLDNTTEGNIIFTDIENDRDLDIILGGLNTSTNITTKIYTNDQSEISPNQDPTPPTVNGTYNNSILHLNWSKGNDTETPEDGLYYNLRVGSKENANEFYSGITAMTSNPNQGFLGNMMQIRNIQLNISNDNNACIVIQVQTIDTGLRKSAWSTPVEIASTEANDGIDNDCDGQTDEGFNTNTPSGGGGGGGAGGGVSAPSSTVTNTETGETIPSGPSFDIPQIPNPPKPATTESPASYENPIVESVINQLLTKSIQLTRTFSISRGKTQVTDRVKNNYPVDQTINLETTIPKEIAANTDEIIEVTDFKVIEYDPVIGFSPTLSSFEEQTLQYTFNKELTQEEINTIVSQITADKEAQEEIKELIKETNQSTNITIKYEIDTETNQTRITLDIDVDNEAALYNVSVFQEIPKCLVEIINDQMIEAENKNFEIINVDPLIVWHFDNILDAKQIQYTINTIADENCTNQLQALAVAKEIVLVKKASNINYFNLGLALSIIPLLALIMIIFGLITRHIEHEDEEVAKLTRTIKSYYKNGYKKYAIKEKLIKLGHPIKRIDECLHLHTQSKIHFWLHRLEIGFEEFILFTLIVLNILDFTETLPGDIDYLKKIISWVLLSYLLYHVSITEVLLGNRKRSLDILLILTFFSLTFKNIISYAKVAWQEVNLVLDLYSYLITNNIIFERYVFIAGIIILLLLSLYVTIFVEIKKPSFLTALHVKEGKLKDLARLPFRFIMIHITLLGFFTIVFNLMMEWLAIAVDALIIVITLIAMLIIIIKHHKKFKIGEFMEETSSFAEHFYEKFVSLFHYKKTIYLGISGMLILHAVTEVGNFVIPYFLGVHDAIYFGNFNEGHMPLFSWSGESLFIIQTASFDLLTKVAVAFIYVANILALLFLLLLPALVWTNFFTHRKLPILETLRFTFTKNHVLNAGLFGLFVTSLTLFITKPVFKLQSLLGGENLAGVDIQTQIISFALMNELILIACALGIIGFIVAFFFHKIMTWVMLPTSYLFFTYYVFLFATSIYNYNVTQFAILINSNIFIAIYTLTFGILSLTFLYAFGFFIITYLYAPPKTKHVMHITPLIKKLFEKHAHHHIHHHDSHKDHLHDTKEESLKEYIQKSLDSGHELFYAVEHLVEHGWPKDLIEEAIEDTVHDPKYKTEVKHIKHYHHNKKKIHELADWIETAYKDHSLKEILEVSLKKTWSEDDIILAFKTLKHLKIRKEDAEVMKYMKIIH